jgi:CMP-N,N'-diacetyllegionaminic acid synthase
VPRTLAVVPARGDSKGLPGKNIRNLAGLPLIEHSLRLAALCDGLARTIVSTDSDEIAAVAEAAGGDVPFRRPAELARDETPMLPVLQHALEELDPRGTEFELLLLLDPTSPGRLPEDVARAHELLAEEPRADGVVSVSEPSFNPIWQAVVERDGFLEPLVPSGRAYGRRQDVPRVFRINACLYLFRTEFLRRERETWLNGRHLMLEVPDLRAFHIDEEDDFRLCELVLREGLVRLPWLTSAAPSNRRG